MATLFLYLAAVFSFVAALLHFACLFWGAAGYQFLGAGKSIVEQAKSGHWYPHFTAVVVGCILTVCALYAFLAANQWYTLPFTPIVLWGVSLVFLIRAAIFPLLKARFAGNSDLFWFVSSTICFVMGMCFLLGALLTK